MESNRKHYLEIKEELILRIEYYNYLLDRIVLPVIEIKRLESIIDGSYNKNNLSMIKKILLDNYLRCNRELEKYYSIRCTIFSLQASLEKVETILSNKKGVKIIEFRTRT